MKLKKLITALFIFLHVCTFSQTANLFTEKLNLSADLKAYLTTTKNPNYIALAAKYDASFGQTTLNDEINKQKITEICKNMLSKGYAPYPHFTSLITCFAGIAENGNVSQQIFQGFIETLSQTLTYQDDKVFLDFINTSNLFFRTNAVFKGSNNSCIISRGTYEFSYEGIAPVLQNSDSTQQSENVVEEAPPVVDTSNQANIFQSNQNLPTLEGPVIKFKDINLRLGSRFDTAVIQNTQGAYMFKTKQFVGNEGKFDWSVLDKNLSNVYATFRGYFFQTQNNFLHIENATLNNSDKLDNTIEGVFEFRSERHTRASAANFPKFISYTNNVSLPKIGKNLSYIGGYSLQGTRFNSACIDGKPASLNYDDGKNKFNLSANTFNFKDSSVSADPAQLYIFIDNDTIMHPGASVGFEIEQRKLKIERSKGVYKNAWFTDTYHKLEYSIDNISWDLNADSMDLDINAAKTQIPAIFKSGNYFTEKEFKKIQSLNQFHPLRVLFYYKRKFQTDFLVADEIISKMKLDEIVFKGAMQDLDRKGFVSYSPISGDIFLKPKASNYILSQENKIDYDAMYVPSLSPEAPNASMEFKNKILTIRGVDKFQISDSGNVYVNPDGKTIKVGYNREIDFDGRLISGFYELKGKGFKFNYQDFNVILKQIDTIKFLVKEKDPKTGKMVDKPLLNQLVYSSGTLYINDPDNKSGKKKMPQYPKFDAEAGANVYFDKKEILGGAYNKRVFFKIPPFKTDSVKSNNKQSVKFEGKFISGGIFPEFDETLKIMKDNSLGFTHEVPQEGYDLYGGKGKFFGTLSLDNNGIRGKGYIEYLSSKWMSNDFVFYQDSVLATGQQAKIKEKTISDVYFPETDIYDFELKWNTEADSMHIINVKEAFDIYKKQLTLEGSLNISPKGLQGAGMLEIKKTNVIASQFYFKQDNVVARHAVFNTKVIGSPKPVMSANNMRVNFNLKDSYADISPETAGLAGLEFPLNQYKTSIENAHWDMNKKLVTMKADSASIAKSYFYSSHPEQDSLVFNAGGGYYDMTRKLLKISGIPYIKVADSKIIPDSNRVTILQDAQMKPFTNAELVIDTLKGFHKLYKGKIEIFSRKKYDGSAVYPYVNAGGDTMRLNFTKFYIEKKKVKKDTIGFTVSNGQITENQKFYITPKILFKGKVKLIATNQLLAFEGKVKLDIKTKGLKTDWFPFKMDGTTDQVVIALQKSVVKPMAPPKNDSKIEDTTQIEEAENEEPIDDELDKLYTGLYYDLSNHDIYHALISNKRNDADEEIININGQLIYDKQTASFKLGQDKRVRNETLFGNMMIYNDSSSTSHCQGKLSLMNSDKNFVITSAGDIKANVNKNIFSGNLFYSIKMNMPIKAMEIMSKTIKEAVEHPDHPFKDSASSQADIDMLSMQVTNIDNEKIGLAYSKALNDLLDYKPLFKYSPKLLEGICISHAHMEWSHAHKAWHNKLHLKMSNILGIDINKRMKGYTEIKKTENGDIFTLFIHPRSDIWFYINYQPGRLSLLSSDAEFMKEITNKSKGESNSPLVYTFVQADYTEKTEFLKSFYKHYLNREYNEEEEEKDIEDKNEETEEPEQEEVPEVEDQKPQKGKNKKITDTEESNAVENEQDKPVDDTQKVEKPKKEQKTKKDKKKKKDDIISDNTTPKAEEKLVEEVKNEENIVKEEKPKKEGKPKKDKKKKKDDITSDETPTTEEKPLEEPQNEEPSTDENTDEDTGGKKKKKKK